MNRSRILSSSLLMLLLVGSLALTSGRNTNASQKSKRASEHVFRLAKSDLAEDEQILHIMNRLAFGPRPGDLERIRKIGLAKYLEAQLHPEGMPDPAVEEKLRSLETIYLTSWELLGKYPDPGMLRQIQQRQNATRRDTPGAPSMPVTPGEPKRPEPPNPPSNTNAGPSPQPGQPPAGMMNLNGPQRIVTELAAAKILREVYSEWQLNEVLVDFWLNHFNVFIQKDAERWLMTEYDRDVIRPHAWGKFKDLLQAVAQSPAMLMYLDNFQSADPTPPQPMFKPLRPYDGKSLAMFPQPGNRNRGLNENYARELLELHTMGVDGGYTQKDVVEVARCFTGWTIVPPQQGGGSIFLAAAHDRGEKIVLGHRIPADGGIEDGLRVLEILVHHPSTARFISMKLVRHLVSDDPPETLVVRVAKVYSDTEGDIREMVRTIITSPEFLSSKYHRSKFKRPLEFLVSALRALDAEVSPSPALFPLLQSMGEPPYGCQPPTGYSDVASEWLSTNQLLRRMNAAVTLSSGRVPGIKIDLNQKLVGIDQTDPVRVTARYTDLLLGNRLPEGEKKSILDKIAEVTASAKDDQSAIIRTMAAALILGSPEFQKQ